MWRVSAVGFLYLVLWASGAAAQKPVTAEVCKAPPPVCAGREAVFIVQTFDPFASAVRISARLLVTNRHVVADSKSVIIKTSGGKKIEARVVPSSYQGDLALIEANGLPPGPYLAPHKSDFSGDMFTVAGDIARSAVRVYPPGRKIAGPYKGKAYARLHHSALSQPGNSGGALVDAEGRLVAVIASGGQNRFDAVPAGEIAKLLAQSGAGHEASWRLLGAALRGCVERLEKLPGKTRKMELEQAKSLHDICMASANRTLLDQAAQALARAGRNSLSIALSRWAVERDPNSFLSRQTLVTTLFIARRFKDTLPHIRILIQAAPEDPVIQRFAVQAGKWGGDMALAKRGLALVKKHNPAQADAAERFLKSDIKVPPRR